MKNKSKFFISTITVVALSISCGNRNINNSSNMRMRRGRGISKKQTISALLGASLQGASLGMIAGLTKVAYDDTRKKDPHRFHRTRSIALRGGAYGTVIGGLIAPTILYSYLKYLKYILNEKKKRRRTIQ